MRSVLSRIRRRLDHLASEKSTILAVTGNTACRSSLRVLAIEQGWRILFADCTDDGLRLQSLNRVRILVYDCDLAGVEEWRDGLRTLLNSPHKAIFPIVIAGTPSNGLRSDVLSSGAYDLARTPLEPNRFAALVNGALALGNSIDALEF